ncbi:hypothetical protein L249_6510 [Ophiocordyceps polyrhachis-furcata BCC 54312]|uniref:Uncharacterized protein n=1 Tax=Ophiocordyceps polyrhachis-furcata BCC 54312 TaxID=1330021 RepID=A0A367LK84_9HYPO|nr:hypothetical protein L249_6510 [Ophiocordyceps polyrhachis-furcata BCC 54312]
MEQPKTMTQPRNLHSSVSDCISISITRTRASGTITNRMELRQHPLEYLSSGDFAWSGLKNEFASNLPEIEIEDDPGRTPDLITSLIMMLKTLASEVIVVGCADVAIGVTLFYLFFGLLIESRSAMHTRYTCLGYLFMGHARHNSLAAAAREEKKEKTNKPGDFSAITQKVQEPYTLVVKLNRDKGGRTGIVY